MVDILAIHICVIAFKKMNGACLFQMKLLYLGVIMIGLPNNYVLYALSFYVIPMI